MDLPRYGNRRLPDEATVRNLVEEGMSDRDIASRYEVSPEAVRKFRHRYGIERPSAHADHSAYIPWKVKASHAQHPLVRRLREYSRQQQGLPLTEVEQQRVENFLLFLRGGNDLRLPLVVTYDRDRAEGFALEPARPGESVIRPPAAS